MMSIWRAGETELRVGRDDPAVLLGILNITPDSFSDGGLHVQIDAAVQAGLRMVKEGARVIDIGGESTRPGAQRVPAAEQIRRVVPAIEALRSACDVLMSIDTTLGEVAQAAVDAGACIINDVAAGTEDADVFRVAAERGCGLVLMHRRVRPDTDSYSDRYAVSPVYADVTAHVRQFLMDRCEAAMAAGVQRKCIAIDPGLGFGKSVQQNYELVRAMGAFVETGFPVLCAASRKSFIGAVSGVDEPRERVMGSVAIAVAAYAAGARLFRVHDVASHREALAVAGHVWRGKCGE